LLSRLSFDLSGLDKPEGEALGERVDVIDETLVELVDEDFVQAAVKSKSFQVPQRRAAAEASADVLAQLALSSGTWLCVGAVHL
jgi:hypothetical protein